MNARSPLPPLVIALLFAAVAPRAAACELDGLSHGYGPMGAMFAGAHRYQSLNGLADEAEERDAGPPPVEPKEPVAAAKPATPRRSFVNWATRKTSTASAGEAPARWTAPPAASTQSSTGTPQQAEPQQGETRQRPPGGGPVP